MRSVTRSVSHCLAVFGFIISLPVMSSTGSSGHVHRPSGQDPPWTGIQHGITYYESNPTYQDDHSGTGSWRFSPPEAQGMNSGTLVQGLRDIEDSPFLLSILIIRHDTIVFERYFNGSQSSHSNNIHSASKSMLPALIAIAIREGYIQDIHWKVSDILPEYVPATGIRSHLTIEHLMRMSAGLYWHEDETEYEIEHTWNWIRSILRQEQIDEPGSLFRYSTGLTHVLSALLTRATGMSTLEFANQYLFDPLDISVEHWGKDPRGIYSGGCNVYMTPREMAKYGLAYLHRGRVNDVQVIPEWMITQSVESGIRVDDTFDYGYNWWLRRISGYDLFLAWGFGGQYIYIIPDLDLVFVTTSDTHNNILGVEINEVKFVRDAIIPSITAP